MSRLMNNTMFSNEVAEEYSVNKAILMGMIATSISYYHEKDPYTKDNKKWIPISLKNPLPCPSYFTREYVDNLVKEMELKDTIFTTFKQDENTTWIAFSNEFMEVPNTPSTFDNLPPTTSKERRDNKFPPPIKNQGRIKKDVLHKEAIRFIRAFPTLICVYILWSGADLSYIGKTTIGMHRVISSANEHRGSKTITHFSIIPIDNETILDTMERMYILEYKPPMNKMFLPIADNKGVLNNTLVSIYSLDKIRLVEDDFYE
jgi:hypothetical protein